MKALLNINKFPIIKIDNPIVIEIESYSKMIIPSNDLITRHHSFNIDALYKRGMAYIDIYMYIASINDFTRFLETARKYNLEIKKKYHKHNGLFISSKYLACAYFFRGYAYAMRKEKEPALKDFDMTIKIEPSAIQEDYVENLKGEIKRYLETNLALLKLSFDK